MKITRHIAPDMRQALRLVRDQLGPDAVILSSRRTSAGVEITAAMDFDAEALRATEALGHTIENQVGAQSVAPSGQAAACITQPIAANTQPARAQAGHGQPAEHPAAQVFASASTRVANTQASVLAHANTVVRAHAKAEQTKQAMPAAQTTARAPLSQSAEILTRAAAMRTRTAGSATQAFAQGSITPVTNNTHWIDGRAQTGANGAPVAGTANGMNGHAPAHPASAHGAQIPQSAGPAHGHAQLERADMNGRANEAPFSSTAARGLNDHLPTDSPSFEAEAQAARAALRAYDSDAEAFSHEVFGNQEFSPQAFATHAPRIAADTAFPTVQPAEILDSSAPSSPTDLMGNELKTLRRMLETQMAQLAWNDLSRRAPIHTEMLRELTEIGLGQELAAQVVAQLPAHTDLTQARRLAIATLSQQVLVTGDRWLEDGGCVALVGSTGVGKTTTLAKLAVRWVLRHGPRDLALVAGDTARIGAHEQLNTLGQLLGAPVYTLDDLEGLPALLNKLGKSRLVLIDTPGSSQRDTLLGARLAALNAVGSRLETALVLAASTQAGASAEAVQRFAAVNPASCVLTKVDEAASLGGVLSVLVRAHLPISYMSEGQRVPEDLRPARSLELVSNAVRLAHSTGAAADEDLLRRRFGEMAHAIA